MDKTLTWLTGMGAGAGLMFLLDPDLGRRRRALVRDQMISAANQLDDCVGATWTDVQQRAQGLMAETSALLVGGHADDIVVEERVRSKLGRYVSHPRAIEVAAHDGRITLSGPILAREVECLLKAVASVPGVTGVENELEIHARAGNVPALQGGKWRPGERSNLAKINWPPATRLLAAASGGALLSYGFTQRFPTSCFLGTVGLGLVARAVMNTEVTRLFGLGGNRRAGNGRMTTKARREEFSPGRTGDEYVPTPVSPQI